MGNMPQRLDVLFLTHNYPRHHGDFAGRFLARLARLLTARGVSVGVIAPHDAGAAEFEWMDDISVWRFRYAADAKEVIAYQGQATAPSLTGAKGLWAHWKYFASFKHLAGKVRSQTTPRIIHAHWWIPGGWVAKSILRNERFVVTSHGTDVRLLEKKAWMRPIARQVYGKADVVTTVSSSLGAAIERVVPQVRDQVRVTPMPPEDLLFHGPVKSRMAPIPIILCVTRFTAQKRNDVLVRALDRMKAAGMKFRARFVGDGGSDRDTVSNLVGQLGLSPDIEFVPSMAQSRLAEEYRLADLTVLPAVDEGFGLALVEAQLCGCPVVGVRSGGILDIIDDESTGLLANPDDPEDLARAMRRVLMDADLRRRLASDGQASALRKFSSKAIVDKFIEWYQLG